MCGIAGYVDFSGATPSPIILNAMAHALRRRGPDASGILIDGPCGLAHARLSIIDLQGSPQPMQFPDSDISLVYNGELYNYRPLRNELQNAGETLSTQGDTEVVLRWIARKWEHALSRFDGMFGFAAWDRRHQRLLLARDPIGEKPLFYATPRPGLLVFGSEIKALLEHPQVDDELDLRALRQVLRFRAVYGSRSLHRDIQQLQPGTFLQFTRQGVRQGQFFDLLASAETTRRQLQNLDESQLIQHGRELLTQSVNERLIADVPVGAFLSGGVDSTLIVALMRRLRASGENIRTFSVGFSQDPFSELPQAKVVADALGTNHTEVHVTEDEYISHLIEMTQCRDAPISEPADIAIARMSRIARQSVKVVLSGEGADEVFAGYPKYHFANTSWIFRTAMQLVGPHRVAWLAGMLGMNPRRALVAARSLTPRHELDRLAQWFSYLDQSDLRQLLPDLDWSQENWTLTTTSQHSALHRAREYSPLVRMQAVDCLTWLPGNMLERGDRMTMAEGLELRPPFLDKELAAFGLALPDRMKIRHRTGKWIVRRWLADLLPPSIASRKKWGFRVPLAQWFRGNMRTMLFDYLTNPHGLCGCYGNRHQVSRLLRQHDCGAIDANLSLWTLLSAEIWYQDVYLKRRANKEKSSVGISHVHLA